MAGNEELHQRVSGMLEALKEGRFRVQSSSLLKSLSDVRIGADGLIDPETVDSSVRAAALAFSAAEHWNDLIHVPLLDVQSAYFKFVDLYFSDLFQEMKRRGATPYDAAARVASTDSIVDAWATDRVEFADALKSFWGAYGDVVHAHVSTSKALKASFGGDLFPSYSRNIASSVGLYVDTIVVPDPLLRIAAQMQMLPPKQHLFLIVKHALTVLCYREIVLADVSPPIMVVAPDLGMLEPAEWNLVRRLGEQDTLLHCAAMFGRHFDTSSELINFLKSFKGDTELIGAIVAPDRLLIDTEIEGSVEAQLNALRSQALKQWDISLDGIGDGLVYPIVTGRMIQANDALFKARSYGAHPLIDAPTSWQYLLWKYEYDMSASALDDFSDAVISRTLAEHSQESVSMLRDVPLDVLLDLRKRNALQELRDVLRRGMDSIGDASPETVSDMAQTVLDNISIAVAAHDKEMRSLQASKRKFYGRDVSGFVVSGGIMVAATLHGNLALGMLSAFAGVTGFPTARELWETRTSLAREQKRLQRSPVALSFRSIQAK